MAPLRPTGCRDCWWTDAAARRSISVYGADGYFQKNDRNAYSLNNVTATKAFQIGRVFVGETTAWLTFARWLTS